MAVVFRCGECQHQLTDPVDVGPPDSPFVNEASGAPYVPEDRCVVSDGRFFTGSAGQIIVNTSHQHRFRIHPDPSRSMGCCGPGPNGGPNLVCACGREVAILWDDCWMPQAILIEPGCVVPFVTE